MPRRPEERADPVRVLPVRVLPVAVLPDAPVAADAPEPPDALAAAWTRAVYAGGEPHTSQ
ncbi:hypothetical protein GCM10023088_22490 [Actinomadura verrucosospora]